MKTSDKVRNELIIKTISTILLLASISYNIFLFWNLREQNLELTSSLEVYNNALAINQRKLTSMTSEKLLVAYNLQKEKENTSLFQNQIQSLVGTVGVLEKLSQTDTDLLKKYSKVYFLNENYTPPKVLQIPEQYVYEKGKIVEIHAEVYPHLLNMLESAKSEGVVIQVASGYRSFGEQSTLKSSYKITYGSGANKFSADQGYSEHQLATTLDFTSPEINGNLVGFDKTKAYAWLLNNSHKFGFTLSYPQGNSYYIFEPWHFRFVSVALATSLFNDKMHFYDLDQRVIDTYLLNFFE